MMKKNKIIWRKNALRHLKDIRKYISFDSEISAKKIVKKIRDSVKRLKSEPFIGQEETELEKIGLRYRYFVEGHYKIYYWVDRESIYIIAVFDTRRNPESLNTEIDQE
jgi:toxin ParE1/3/4